MRQGLIVRLEEAKKNFDWQDLVDLIDQFVREAEKQEETIKKFEEEKNEWILLNDINRRKIIELEQGNQKNLKEIEMLRKTIMEMQKIGG